MGGIYVGKEDLEYMREKSKSSDCNNQHLRRIGNKHMLIFKCKNCGKVINKTKMEE